MPDDSPRLYITFTTKPLAIAAREGLPAIEAKVLIGELSGDNLMLLADAALKRLEASDGAD